jgi:putative FmdB family regulatory protein
MPVYEFYCSKCHAIYSFRTAGFDVDKSPRCPDCRSLSLKKQISLFAISKGRDESAGEDGMPEFDEKAMEQAMAAMENEAGALDEENPRDMARFMRKLYDSTGLKLSGGMEEAVRRMEAGEDPDKIEEEMGDVLEADDVLFGSAQAKKLSLAEIKKRFQPPRVDPTLYELD